MMYPPQFVLTGILMMGSSTSVVNVICRARSLRRLQRGGAQREIVELEIEAKSEILAVVAGDAGSSDSASAAHEIRGVAVGQAGSAANVKGPFFVEVQPWMRGCGLDSSGVASCAATGLRRRRRRLSLRRFGLGAWAWGSCAGGSGA